MKTIEEIKCEICESNNAKPCEIKDYIINLCDECCQKKLLELSKPG